MKRQQWNPLGKELASQLQWIRHSLSFGGSNYNYSSIWLISLEAPAILILSPGKGELQKAGGGHSFPYEK